MKKQILLIAILACVTSFVTTSCSSKMYSTRQTPILRESIPANPIIADMEVSVDKKIKGTATLRGGGATFENARQMALWDAMESNLADVVIDPIFSIRVRKGLFSKRITAEVMGYKGTYTGVHVASEREIENLLMYREAQPMMLQGEGTATKGRFFNR
jgi:hypothetical protein